MAKKSQQINAKNKDVCPTNGYIRAHDVKYLLRRQPANTLRHGPADPRRWAAKFCGITIYILGRSMRADAPVKIKL